MFVYLTFIFDSGFVEDFSPTGRPSPLPARGCFFEPEPLVTKPEALHLTVKTTEPLRSYKASE